MGSASEGMLYPGDKVASINHQDTSRMSHLEAQNMIKSAGTLARLDIIRPGISAMNQGMKTDRSGSLGSSGSGNKILPGVGLILCILIHYPYLSYFMLT